MTLLTALLALAPNVAPAQPTAPISQDLLSFFIESTDNLLKHPKDQAMRGAMDLLGARLLELPGEIPDMRSVPQNLIPMVYDMIGSAKTVRIMDAREAGGMLPVSALVMVDPRNQEKADLWMATMEGLMRQAGAPIGVRDAENWLPFEGAPFPVRMGAANGAMMLAAAEPTVGPLVLESAKLPENVAPSFAMRMDLGTAMDMLMPFMEMGEPELASIVADAASTFHLDEFSMEMACGSDSTKNYTNMVFPGWGSAMREMGVLPAEGLTAADLRVIPADAKMANIQSFDMGATLDAVLDFAQPFLAEQGVEDPIAMLEGMTGVNLKTDLLDHVGSHMGSYFADSTGGGGLMSMVMFLEAKDPAQLEAGLMRISGLVNGVLAQQAEGYVMIRTIERQGKTCHTLTFPGLPIPFEPTLVMGQNNLFIGLTPQAALVGAQQEMGSSPSLLENMQFADNFDGKYENLVGVSFFRNDAFMREGYGLTSLLCSGLANGVRSKLDPARDAGLIMPTFPVLMKDVRPTVSVTRVNAVGDLVVNMEGDPSFLVNMTRGVGYLASNPAAWLGFLPALAGSSRMNAMNF